MSHSSPLRLGTRSSKLALVQANWVANQLQTAGYDVELIRITTQGDASTQPLSQAGGIGLFTKAIQQALLDDEVDLAVHSLKDLPTEQVPGLVLAAVPVRESVCDVLVTLDGRSLNDLAEASVIGTGSVRRRAQLLHARPNLQIAEIRGNVDTRLEKLAQGKFEAIVLAAAGLRRLGLFDQRCSPIPIDVMLPAVGQGALGIEIRSEDAGTANRVAVLNRPLVHQAVISERTMLQALSAGCLAPVGAYTELTQAEVGNELRLTASVFSPEGRQKISYSAAADVAAAGDLGNHVAEELIQRGAGPLIQAAR